MISADGGGGGGTAPSVLKKDVVITSEHKGAVPVEGRIDHPTPSGLLHILKINLIFIFIYIFLHT